jgi:hypothetical protein
MDKQTLYIGLHVCYMALDSWNNNNKILLTRISDTVGPFQKIYCFLFQLEASATKKADLIQVNVRQDQVFMLILNYHHNEFRI